MSVKPQLFTTTLATRMCSKNLLICWGRPSKKFPLGLSNADVRLTASKVTSLTEAVKVVAVVVAVADIAVVVVVDRLVLLITVMKLATMLAHRVQLIVAAEVAVVEDLTIGGECLYNSPCLFCLSSPSSLFLSSLYFVFVSSLSVVFFFFLCLSVTYIITWASLFLTLTPLYSLCILSLVLLLCSRLVHRRRSFHCFCSCWACVASCFWHISEFTIYCF